MSWISSIGKGLKDIVVSIITPQPVKTWLPLIKEIVATIKKR